MNVSFYVLEHSRDLVSISNDLAKIYSTARVNSLVLEPDLVDIMATSRDPDVLLGAWWGWREATGPKMKDKYADFVQLSNQGAVDNGK